MRRPLTRLSPCVGAATLAVLLIWGVCRPASVPEGRVRKVLVLYAYFEKSAFYAETLRFFLTVGVQNSDHIDYVFILQGSCSVPIPKRKNIFVHHRKNECFDFGAYGATFTFLGGLQKLASQYKAAIFLNPSVVGPILPKYWPPSLHWSSIFTHRLVGGVEVVGTSLVCLPRTDAGGYGPRVEGMAWAASMAALQVAEAAGVFRCFTSKHDAIVEGEYGLSRAVLSAGMNLDSLLLKYGSIDWRESRHWDCNRNRHPSRNNSYENISVHPLEVVFHKPRWLWDGEALSDVYLNEVKQYMRWAAERVA